MPIFNPNDLQTQHSGSSDEKSVLCLKDLSFSYEEQRVLDKISLEIEEGSWVSVLGSNGSGKSTLALVCAGLLQAAEGSLEILGGQVMDKGEHDLAAYDHVRPSIGLVFQNPEDQIVTTIAADDVAFGPENLCLDPQEISKRVYEQLKAVGLSQRAEDDPMKFSGGQQQRLTLAGSLAMQPRLLILDEPAAMLDVRGRKALIRLVKELKQQNISLIHITHHMEDILEADRALVLDKGRIVADTQPEELMSFPSELLKSWGLVGTLGQRLNESLEQLGKTKETGQLKQILQTPLKARGLSFAEHISRYFELKDQGQNSDKTSLKPKAKFEAEQKNHEACLVAEHLSFSYSSSLRIKKPNLNDLSFKLKKGSLTALIGPTGSGKTSLARLLLSLEKADSGTLSIFSTPLNNKGSIAQLRGQLGYVMQKPERQLFEQSVLADVMVGPLNLGLSHNEAQIQACEALKLVGLSSDEDFCKRSPFELSGGQQRLVALAGTLAMKPKLIVMDEPTAGLDPQACLRIMDCIDRLVEQGLAILLITHQMEEAARASQVLLMHEGKLIAAGKPQEIFCDKEKLTSYGLDLPEAAQLHLELLRCAQHLGLKPEQSSGQTKLCMTLEELAAQLQLKANSGGDL